MKYPLETLGHERFQQVCQALLLKDEPHTQCFPLNQADGGRDAISPASPSSDEFIVFQVKYSVDPSKIVNVHGWLTAKLEGEKDKVARLKERGARAFVLMTNIPGTGLLDRGSIDKINATLRSVFPVKTYCWWRDDIKRRLDDAWNIKWTFPEILSNYDIIRMLLEHQDSQSADRRTKAVRAAMRGPIRAGPTGSL